MQKKCFKCGEEKDLGMFYKHSRMADGHLNKCKECTKRDSRGNNHVNRKARAEYEKKRFQRPERKEQVKRYQKKTRENNKEKYKARCAVSNALRDGKIFKENCKVCGDANSQAHHDDYSKPLDVKWLCRKHHLAEHGKIAY